MRLREAAHRVWGSGVERQAQSGSGGGGGKDGSRHGESSFGQSNRKDAPNQGDEIAMKDERRGRRMKDER